ncbi:MAG: RecX family transcriptional regulator [Saprospiraceae bacterium]|nr:RecX family transcriptional regulator [Saprospiraceae bacterium]
MAKQKVTQSEALSKLQRYCTYQDRCHQEVRYKLLSLGMRGEMLEEIMVALIQESFLNEERFARSFVRGKFRMNGWGRQKIAMGLRKKGVPGQIISQAMDEIDMDDYKTELLRLLSKKKASLPGDDSWTKQRKLFGFAISKGYESDLVSACIKELKSTT